MIFNGFFIRMLQFKWKFTRTVVATHLPARRTLSLSTAGLTHALQDPFITSIVILSLQNINMRLFSSVFIACSLADQYYWTWFCAFRGIDSLLCHNFPKRDWPPVGYLFCVNSIVIKWCCNPLAQRSISGNSTDRIWPGIKKPGK